MGEAGRNLGRGAFGLRALFIPSRATPAGTPGQDALIAQVIEGALARMEADRKAMVAADEHAALEGTQDGAAQARTDKAADDVREVLVPGRRSLGGMFGDDYLTELGFDGPTPDDPAALLHLGRIVQARLSQVTPPSSPFGDGAPDPAQLLSPLGGRLDTLEATLDHRRDERRETQVALDRKHASMARFDRSFAVTANLVSTFLDLIDQRELARKVRPSRRRPGNTVSVAGGESEPVLPEPPPLPESGPAAGDDGAPAGDEA